MSIDWDNPFKPEDFDYDSHFTEIANARFRELIEEHGRPVWRLEHGGEVYFPTNRRRDFGASTHEAILICQKEIK